MARVFLAMWLAAFTLQTSEVLTLVAPDACSEDVLGSSEDPCAEGCLRCLCCARMPPFVPQVAGDLLVRAVSPTGNLPPKIPSTTPSPRGVLHVPKHS